MKFEDFNQLVPKITNLKLPGEVSHYKMAPLLRKKELEALKFDEQNPRRAAVLSLFYPDYNGVTNFILILRKEYKGVHSNQVGFPGGKVELIDENLQATALRETEEEVGVDAKKVKVFKELSDVYIPPSNFLVTPFMGITYETPKFVLEEQEVEEILEIPVVDLLKDETVFNKNLTTSYARNIDVPAFKLNEYTVWGATAMMLSEVKEIIKSVY
ncbi:NUDIX hydrolase [Zhouia amylolytica]|uniref:NUDIX hydrolase n=1 Tax=Zhouia amylolytica TaxID=376730 RepID=UPI0020CFC304|nr:CoA pyrophosphatase [Zhouia amylolytica]MCQ0109985.1 CoA pyrophosphatase [Zhouia amylolytica]